MKSYLFLVVFVVSLYSFGQSPTTTIEAFFIGFHQRDSVQLAATLHESARFQTTVYPNSDSTRVVEETLSDFYHTIATIPTSLHFEERLETIEIKEDGNIAQAWVPYSFYVNDQFSHQGVNAFTLVRNKNNWLIIYLIDTRYKTNKQ